MRGKICKIDQSKGKIPVLPISDYGNKAHWLAWLGRSGFSIPYTIALPAGNSLLVLEKNDIRILQEFLKKLVNPSGKYSLAIRSSSTCEDSENQSFAGHFLTILGEMSFEEVINNINKVRSSLGQYDQGNQMGVVVQELVNGEFSGVVFSSSPLTMSKHEVTISLTKGLGETLVSGKGESEDINIIIDGGSKKFPTSSFGLPDDAITELVDISKDIEKRLAYPVDIEWSCANSKIFCLQCRPQTASMTTSELPIKIVSENRSLIPLSVIHNKKVSIRLAAEENGVHISQGFLRQISNRKKHNLDNGMDLLQPSAECVGYSVVLIYPQSHNGKILRHFSDKSSLPRTLKKIARATKQNYWECTVIIQEIYRPTYTGIIKKINNNFVVELAYGHFVPKGLVPTSRYLVENSEIIEKDEVYQSYLLDIVNGVAKKIKITPPTKISPGEEIVVGLTRDFECFLDNGRIVEFGIVELNTTSENLPYLIDVVESNESTEREIVNLGVMSPGEISGKVIKVDLAKSMKGLNTHFHDEIEVSKVKHENSIFMCERPDISLLELIKACDRRTIGFIFRSGSLLAHLPIILRELGIPAICIKDTSTIKEGGSYYLKASPVSGPEIHEL